MQTMGFMTNGAPTFLPTGPSLATERRILIVVVMRAEVAEAVESNCLPLARPRSTADHRPFNLRRFASFLSSNFDARENADRRRLHRGRSPIYGRLSRCAEVTSIQSIRSSPSDQARSLANEPKSSACDVLQSVPALEIPSDVRTEHQRWSHKHSLWTNKLFRRGLLQSRRVRQCARPKRIMESLLSNRGARCVANGHRFREVGHGATVLTPRPPLHQILMAGRTRRDAG